MAKAIGFGEALSVPRPPNQVKQTKEPIMPVAEEAVREALKQVVDPELFVNIVDLGLVYGIQLPEVEEKTNVELEMTLTSPACPAGPQIIAQAKDVLGRMEGIGAVEVKLVMTPPWTPDRMTEEAKDQLGIF
jgi:metal-sulfur cluster biosynthetic enzyme